MFPELWLDGNGIIRERHSDQFITVNTAMYAAAERKKLAVTKKVPLLVEFKELLGFAKETRDMDLKTILANVSALAYFVDPETKEGAVTMAFINQYFDFAKWPIPVKVFQNEQDAINWLCEHL